MHAVYCNMQNIVTRNRTFLNEWAGYGIILLVTVTLALFAGEIDAYEQIHEFTRAHEDWELDEAITLALCSVFGLTGALVLRTHRLNREIRLREQLEVEATQLARHDALTGLANRRHLEEKAQSLIASANKSGSHVSFLSVDLDRFKPVNDIHGHSVGDRTLQVVTDRILECIRSNDLAARVGGDEFAVIIGHEPGEQVPERIARRILAALVLPIDIDGHLIHISASIGIAGFPNDATDFNDLLVKADLAMYRAKQLGRDSFTYYDPTIGNMQRERSELEAQLRRAIRSKEIVPYLQPLISLQDNKLSGFEILARWQHPEKGLIPPDQFIHIAEDCGLIGELMFSVLDTACETVSGWPGDFKVSVNLSPAQISDAQLVEKLKAVLGKNDFACERLEIEITEAIFIADSDRALAMMDELKAAGFSIALDDFGTGYSSMRYLSEFPLDKVKIDKSFIMGRGGNDKNEKIVNSIILLGHSLGLMTTAEGIENNGDVEWLVDQGCELGQGYLYSPPVPVSAALSFVEAPESNRDELADAAGQKRHGNVTELTD